MAISFVRASNRLCIRLIAGRLVTASELVGTSVNLPLKWLSILEAIVNPVPEEVLATKLSEAFPNVTDHSLALNRLFDAGIIIRQGTSLDVQELDFKQAWPLGQSTAAHALAVERLRLRRRHQELEYMASTFNAPKKRAAVSKNAYCSHVVALPPTVAPLFDILSKRRSSRRFNKCSIPLSSISAILASGLSVVKTLTLPHRPPFELRMTPSPGGLNAVNGYLIVRSVSGLEEGVFRYNSGDGSIEKIAASQVPDNISDFFGYQSWADEASAIVILIADLETLGWKYRDPGAYNALLLEAGHVAQNMAICAGFLGLRTVFTNALNGRDLCNLAGLDWPNYLPLYSIAVGDADGILNAEDDYDDEDIERLRQLMDKPI